MTKAVIFDVGNVLIEWDVRHLYRQLLPDDAAIDAFLDETGLLAANVEFDRGLPFAEGIADLCQKFPQHADLLRAFDTRWMDCVPGEIAGSVAILRLLGDLGVPRYAITNFSREKWALSTERFPFLRSEFIDIVVSAHEGIVKPDPAIYRLLLDRNGLDAGNCIFIDDSAANIVAAREAGIDAIHFTPATQLRQELAARGIAP